MLTHIRNLILDMDGVLWRGDTPMPGLADFFATLRRLDINFMLATNNATKTAVLYQQKFARFGVEIPPEQILTSSEATAGYLRTEYGAGTTVYTVGTEGMRDAMRAQGFVIVTPDEVADGATAAVVVVGMTPETYYKELAMGALLVGKGAKFVGTNPDPSFPSEMGPLPGAGALLAVIETATGIKPITIGKPGPIMFSEAVCRLNGSSSDTAMVGDRLTTDIAGAKAAGIQAIMVLSGISTRADVAVSDIKPDFIFEYIRALAAALKKDKLF